MAARWLLWTLAWLSLSSPAAAAEGGRRLFIAAVGVGSHGEDEAAARLLYQAERSVAKDGRHAWVDAAQVFDRAGSAEREARARGAEEALAGAREAYSALEIDKALAAAEAAIQGFAQGPVSSLKGIAAARMLKIAALAVNGDANGAKAEMTRVLMANPRTAFDPNLLPPDLIAQARFIKEQLEKRDGLPVQVDAVPKGARVYVEGMFRGFAPLDLSRVGGGDWVTVQAPGYAPYQGKLQGDEERLSQPLTPLPEAVPLFAFWREAARDPHGSGRNRAAVELGKAAVADEVLALVVEKRSSAGFKALAIRLAVRDGHTLAFAEDTLPDGERLAAAAEDFFSRVLLKDEPRSGGKAVVHTEISGIARRRTMGYSLLGTAGAMLTAGVALGLGSEGKLSAFRRTPQTDYATLTSLRSSGRSFAFYADLSYLLAFGAAVAGTYLAFLPSDGDEPEAPVESPAAEEGPGRAQEAQPAAVTHVPASASEKRPVEELAVPKAKKSEDSDDLRDQ